MLTAVLAATAAVALSALVASAPAGNRDAAATFDSFPGPAEVTFGENIAYRATLGNPTGTTLTQVRFEMTTPSTTVTSAAGQDVTLTSTLVYSSCEAPANRWGPFDTAGGYTCPSFPNLANNAPGYTVTLVWTTSALPTGATCAGALECVLSTTGTWRIKESNNTTPSQDTFSTPVTNSMLVQPNPSKSGGYALATVKPSDCTTSSANVITNQSVGATNKIATAVCAGKLPATTVDPGVVIEIKERPGTTDEPGFTDVSEICIPKPGFECPLGSETNAWVFTDTLATLIFRIPETSDWKAGEKLDVAYHNDVPHTFACTFVRDGKTKIWTVTCPTDSNGSWRFG